MSKVAVEKKALPSETLGPADTARLLGLARTFLDGKDYVGAEAAAFAATECDPASLGAWTALGVANARLSRPDRAIAAFLRALAIAPTTVDVWVDLGETYLAKGDYELAAHALRSVCELDLTGDTPGGRRARALIGRTLALLKKA